MFLLPYASGLTTLTILEPIADPENFEKRKGEAPHREEARKKQEKDVATHAGQCISLYFAVMAFSQKAIDRIHAYYRNDDAPVRSDRIDEGACAFL
jgi:hypothetical protein